MIPKTYLFLFSIGCRSVAEHRRGAADCGQRREATEATEKALNSDAPQVQWRWAGCEPAENLIKGDRNANEEI